MTTHDLSKEIMEYESDTFSASGSKITREEADFIAEKLLEFWSKENLDGISITNILDVARDK